MFKRQRQSSQTSDGGNSSGSSAFIGKKSPSIIGKKFVPLKRTVTPSSLSRSNSLASQSAGSEPCCVIQRVPFFGGGKVTSTLLHEKKFQRPDTKRRAYGKSADVALKHSTLGQKRRFNGMDNIFARSGKPLYCKGIRSETIKPSENSDDEDDENDDAAEPEKGFEPLELWTSPHQGGKLKGLPAQTVREKRPDEFGIEEEVTVLKPARIELYSKNSIFVPPLAAKWLRPHQREGVKFMYECVMGLRDYRGNGCILADDMGLGKTLQSVSLIYTLLKSGITADGAPTASRVIVVCPCSLVKNWEFEFMKWFGVNAVKTEALADQSRKEIERSIDSFCKTRIKNVLIASYECIRMHIDRFKKYKNCCDLLVCDEAHRLKNSDNQTSRALNSLPVKRRVLLTGTPMQNDLQEFYAMVDFTNPMILGEPEEFRKKILFPILRGREPDATEAQKKKMMEIQNDMSSTVNDFILRRINTLNAQHLPPKLVQVVCCNLTEIQKNMYQHLISSKDTQHILDGKQVNCLASIQLLMKLSNHPSLVAEDDRVFGKPSASSAANRRAGGKVVKYNDDPDKETQAVPGADGIARFLPCATGGGGSGRNNFEPVHPEWSGKMFVLYRLMREMRKPGNGGDKIVIISNYTQTLDLIGRMCRENSWGSCRLDGSVCMKKRQKMVEEFNDPESSLVAFLLSSKAGGCGLNLIGGNRLVLFDPDWNPAVDKQAAARCWRDGQKKRCFTYRFLATGTVEEKIFQRQLSKEGLQSVVDDKEQVNALSTKDLRNLFKLRHGTPSDTHDKLRCDRCKIIQDNAEIEASSLLPKKLEKCRELFDEICSLDDSQYFLTTLDPTLYERTKEEYEKFVKQPIDFEVIKKKLDLPVDNSNSYQSVSGFSKDVNRVFGNVMKVWSPGEGIADAARRLQTVWMEKWTDLVPLLMRMTVSDTKGDDGSDNDEMETLFKSCATVNNERGIDYQEQIGMPDEENMRHWSHHYSTDTVDDPVFRAAMRGSDSVSFVFGLEVTWSLIQQRQQEEEEKLALQALECIQESDDDESAGSGEDKNEFDDGCNVKNVHLIKSDSTDLLSVASRTSVASKGLSNHDDSESEEEACFDEDEPTGVSVSEDSHSRTTERENSSKCSDGKSVSQADLSDDEDDAVEDVHNSQSCCSNATKEPFRDITNLNVEPNNQMILESKNEKSQDPDLWACISCTLLNKKKHRKCTMCRTPNPAFLVSVSKTKKK